MNTRDQMAVQAPETREPRAEFAAPTVFIQINETTFVRHADVAAVYVTPTSEPTARGGTAGNGVKEITTVEMRSGRLHGSDHAAGALVDMLRQLDDEDSPTSRIADELSSVSAMLANGLVRESGEGLVETIQLLVGASVR